MLLVVSISAMFSLQDAGRVEVEGLVITASAKQSLFSIPGPEGRTEYEVELAAAPKSGGALPIVQFREPIRVSEADGKPLSIEDQFVRRSSRVPKSGAWTARLVIRGDPLKTLPVLEGLISVAEPEWKAATFDAAALKPNATVKLEGGCSVKLIVFDLGDGPPDVRFRLTIPSAEQPKSTISGARAVFIHSDGKEVSLSGAGSGYRGDGKTFDHYLRFRGDEPIAPGSLRGLRLEAPIPKGAARQSSFRILNVPVAEIAAKRRAK